MSDITIIINYWGGIPSCLVKKSLNSLNHFKSFSLGGTFVPNAYITNTDALESFKDFLCNKRMNGFPVQKKDSIFHTFKNSGYHTVLLGCFGLDEKMNPTPPRREYINDTRYSLEEFGIDRFSSQDGCYHMGSAYSHDEKVLLEANEIVMNASPTNGPLLLFINLLGCNDCFKRRFDEPTFHQEKCGISKNKWYLNPDVNDVRLVPRNVDFVKKSEWKHIFDTSKKIENKKYGEPLETANTLDSKIKFLSLQSSGWSDLLKLDDLIIKVLKNSRKNFATIKTCILSTNVISMEEHGVRHQAPVESCCKSFWIYSDNELDRPAEEESNPMNLLNFWDVFIKNLNSKSISTFCILPTVNIDMKTNCLRNVVYVRGKLYSVNYIWSFSEMLKMNGTNLSMSTNKTQWNVKLSMIHAVFDLTEDSYEINNIVEFCSTELLEEFAKNINLDFTIFMNIKKYIREEEFDESTKVFHPNPENTKPPNQALLRAQKSRYQILERREELAKKEAARNEAARNEAERNEAARNETARNEDVETSKESTNPFDVKLKPKGILKFDTNPPKVWEFERYIESKTPQKASSKSIAATLRKRESDLNQKHR